MGFELRYSHRRMGKAIRFDLYWDYCFISGNKLFFNKIA